MVSYPARAFHLDELKDRLPRFKIDSQLTHFLLLCSSNFCPLLPELICSNTEFLASLKMLGMLFFFPDTL